MLELLVKKRSLNSSKSISVRSSSELEGKARGGRALHGCGKAGSTELVRRSIVVTARKVHLRYRRLCWNYS